MRCIDVLKSPYITKMRMLAFLLVTGIIIFLWNTKTTLHAGSYILQKVKKIFGKEEYSSLNLVWPLPVEHSRRLAATIASIQREMSRLEGKESPVDSEWSIKLAAVAKELYPRIPESSKTPWDYSARLPNMKPREPIPGRTRHVCPEVYYGNKYDHPFSQHGMEPDLCKYVPPFHGVLTAVLPATKWTSDAINFVVMHIRHSYDIPIVAIVSSSKDLNTSITDFTIKQINENYDEAKFINGVLGAIKTPYVLMGTNMAHFNNQSSLERLVRVLDDLEQVKVAGGSARDSKGLWIHGCLQQKMAYYQAVYTMGYYYSKYECMYCDDLLTPFVTAVQQIKDIPFTEGLNGSVMYHDWFAKIRLAGHLTMTCPDVMFYVTEHSFMREEDWLAMAKKWSLQKIHSYDDKFYNFSCDSVAISCAGPLNIIKNYLLPPCCGAIMEDYIDYLEQYGREHKLPREFQAGSALGAVKMGTYLPWDFDTDYVFECRDFKKWMEMKQDPRKPESCNPSVTQVNKYITVNCKYFFLELYCHSYNVTSHQYLPDEYKNITTTIIYSNRPVSVSANPALHSRNKIGFNILKHAAHWRTLKTSKEGQAKGGYDKPGSWNPCKTPQHHSCLDRYTGDGNLPFLKPFLRL